MHIDTTRISHAYRRSELPEPDELFQRNFAVKHNKRGNNRIWTAQLRPHRNESIDPYLFLVISEFGYCGISAEFSAAKLVNGNGLGGQTDEDIYFALDAVEDFIRTRTGVEFDARTAKVNRFDVNADFPVGESRIGLYVQSASRPYSRLVNSKYESTTNYFYNKSRTFAIYAKMKEMEKQFKKEKFRGKMYQRRKGCFGLNQG